MPASVDEEVREQELKRIPGPRTLPVLGNLLDLDLGDAIESLVQMGKQYGGVYALRLGGQREIIVTSRRVFEELCDEKRFCKYITRGIAGLRELLGDGLITAHSHTEGWHLSHSVLKPLMGPDRIRGMFDDMKDICQQLCLKWARTGDTVPLDVSSQFTCLALDTIGLCAFNHRFNSFYGDEDAHCLIKDIINFLGEADIQSVLPDYINRAIRFRSVAAQKARVQRCRDLLCELVKDRRKRPTPSKDILTALLNARDPKTGEALSDAFVVDNVITFITAGKETTSGLLSFAIGYLLDNPNAMRKAREEVHRVIGLDDVTLDHLQKLPYIEAILRETLRLQPISPGMYLLGYRGDELLAKKYMVKQGEPIFVVLHAVQRDEAVYGADADEFKPERMDKAAFAKLPNGAWKAFGNGARACVGRAFAWQEAVLAMAMVLQNFDIEKDDRSYRVTYTQALTIKPVPFKIRVRLRRGRCATQFARELSSGNNMFASADSGPSATLRRMASGQRMTVLYASNAGTLQALANRLASVAAAWGFAARIESLKAVRGKLPADEPVVIITASYNGKPAEDAAAFVAWIRDAKESELQGVTYAVFGCGNRDWAETLFAVPKFVDARMESAGATRLVQLGLADSAVSDLFSDLEDWAVEELRPALREHCADEVAEELPSNGIGPADVAVADGVPVWSGFMPAVVTETRLLSNPTSQFAAKRQLELRLPECMEQYRAGEHLLLLARNSEADVHRALTRFGLGADTPVVVPAGLRKTGSCPPAAPPSTGNLFGLHLQLGQTASRRDVKILEDATVGLSEKLALHRLTQPDTYEAEVRAPRVSVLDLLDRFPTATPTLACFLGMMKPNRPRTYSVSSAAAWRPGRVSLTYSVLESPGRGPGFASSYMASLEAGAVVQVARPPRSTPIFRLPAAEGAPPVIMVAAGTGLAPFRGLLQERMLQRASSPVLLFYGCHGPSVDDIYRDELDELEQIGIVDVIRAYSHQPFGECRHVGDSIRRHGERLSLLWQAGAVVMVCGSSQMADSVLEAVLDVLSRRGLVDNIRDKETLRACRRYLEEIFA